MHIRKTSEYILAYALWIVTCALAIFIAFWAVRSAIRSLAEFLTMGTLLYGTPHEQFQVPYTRNAVDRFAVVILGVLSVLVVVVVEHYYRTGVDEGRLVRRFLRVTTLEFAVLFVALAIQVVVAGALGLFTIWSLVVPLLVLAVTVGLSWLSAQLPQQAPQ